jgi:hypothetical protein
MGEGENGRGGEGENWGRGRIGGGGEWERGRGGELGEGENWGRGRMGEGERGRIRKIFLLTVVAKITNN